MPEEAKEYSLAELVNDPIVRLLMRSDGVDRQCLELLIGQLRQDREQRQSGAESPLFG